MRLLRWRPAVTGFALAVAIGILLATAIVHSRLLDRGLLPWVIVSQSIPVLATAPMIVVVLGNAGFTGLLPKAVISASLAFFPVTIGMCKGLRAAGSSQMELLRTYNASTAQVFSQAALAGFDPVSVSGAEGGVCLGHHGGDRG